MRKLTKMMALASFLLGVSFSANAWEVGTEMTIDKGTAVGGEQYTLSQKGDYYLYTATESGVIEMQTTVTDINTVGGSMYGSTWTEFFGEQLTGEPNVYTQVNPQSYSTESTGLKFVFPVTAEKVYAICWPATNSDMSAGFTFEILTDEIILPDQDITSVYPEPGTTFDYSTYKDITISASASIDSFGKVTFSYGSTEVELNTGDYENLVVTNGPPTGLFIQVGGEGKQAFASLIDQAAQNGDGSFTITIEDVMAGGVLVTGNTTSNSSVTVNNGTVSVTYEMQPIPKYLEAQSTWPDIFYAKWETGDQSAVATLQFSQDIANVESVSIKMGDVVPGQDTGEETVTSYTVTPQINGSTVTLDFAGVERVANVTTVSIWVTSVTNAQGIAVDFGEYGTILCKQIDYVDNTQEPAVGTIEWDKLFTVSSENPTWTLETGDYSGAIKIQTNSTTNLLDNDAFLYYDLVEGMEIGIGSTSGMQAEVGEDNYYFYTYTVNANTTYTVKNVSGTVDFTFSKLANEEPQGPVALTEGANEMNTVSPYVPYYYELPGNGSLTFTVQLNGDGELEADGYLYSDEDHLNIITPSSAVSDDGNYKYVYENLQEGQTVYFYQTLGTCFVFMTYTRPALAAGNVVYVAEPDPAVYIYWNESIQEVDPDYGIDGYFAYPGYNVNEDLMAVVSGSITSYNPAGSSDLVNNAVMFDIKNLVAEYGAGNYTVYLYDGSIMNGANSENETVTGTFEVEALPSVSQAEPVVTVSGDEITVVWTVDDEIQTVSVNEAVAEESDILVITPDWTVMHSLNIGTGVSVADNAVVIDLTELNLEVGVTYELIIPEQFFYVGEDGALNEPVDYEFKALSSGVVSLLNANDASEIYNLRGVRVSNPAKGGIYIINGKKVLVK